MAEYNDETAHPGPRTHRASSSTDPGADKVHHTVTACVRCRKRKTRCDPGLPRCEPCERSNARCEYFDSTKNRTISRSYITSLQSNLRRLQTELAAVSQPEDDEPNFESMARGAGLIKFSEHDESRFLGPSSGIAVTRFVMNLAKQNSVNRSIKDIVPDRAAQEIKEKFEAESAKPTSKIYPLISSVAAPNLPSVDLMERLIDLYMAKSQYLLPLLHEPTFRQEVQALYHGSAGPTLNFQLRLVIAISMQKLDTQYAGLADSYYLAALPYLEACIRKMDLSTLQCLTLIAQYSLLTPTRTAAYWVVGLAVKLSQELGLCEERTIKEFPPGTHFNPLEIDMRRRLFWIITSMEFGLAHTLGRPSACGVTVDNIDVQFFEKCDDRYISSVGLLPGYHAIMKKCLAIHFFTMRNIQAEIRRTLYLKKRETPQNDQDPWFAMIHQKMDDWVTKCPKNDEGSGLSYAWFHGRRNTMIVFMYRPSPQIPHPSVEAAHRCYNASVENTSAQKYQIENKLVDLTWILTQTLFMAVNTILWSLSYAEIREQHPVEEVRKHLQNALAAIDLTADRWPGVLSARQLYGNLIEGCLKAYDSEASFSITSPSKSSPTSTQDVSSPPSQLHSYSPASTGATSYVGAQSPQSFTSSYGTMHKQSRAPSEVQNDSFPQPAGFLKAEVQQHPIHDDPYQQSRDIPQAVPGLMDDNNCYLDDLTVPSTDHQRLPDLSYQSFSTSMPLPNDTPSSWDEKIMFPASSSNFPSLGENPETMQPWLGAFGSEYSRYMHQNYFPTSHQMQSLSMQEQHELMASLEDDAQMPDISTLVSDSNTYYTALFP